jgi:hypothetical protein
MRKTIASHTPAESSYPPFISVDDVGNAIVVTIRGKRVRDDARGYDLPGPLAEMRLSDAEWADLVTACNLYKRGTP